MTVVKFPYDACRRVHSRKPRRSKNGTPEERAAKEAEAAAALSPAATVLELPGIPRRSLLEQEFREKIDQLDPLDRKYIEGYFQALIDNRSRQ
jgi:hypothetical protein